MTPSALIVYGGYAGHEPEKTTGLVAGMLGALGFETVQVPELDPLADAAYLSGFDLIVLNWSVDTITAEQVTPELVSEYLFTVGVPDPDLIIRTSGEMRVSNFLIWQGAYSEWYITPTFWPDFDRDEFYKALVDFGHRDRRYGLVASDGSID